MKIFKKHISINQTKLIFFLKLKKIIQKSKMQKNNANNNDNHNFNDNFTQSSSSLSGSNNPFNYYALFLNESSKTENFYDKYFLRISDDDSNFQEKTSESSFGSRFLSFFSNSFSASSSNKTQSTSDLKSQNLCELETFKNLKNYENYENFENEEDMKFVIDKQIKQEKIRRLGETDSLYKIKKHHQNNLNMHYRKQTKLEKSELEQEIAKEQEYLRLCRAGESKLKQSKLNAISLKELNAVIKRNYILFTNEQKNDLSKINNLYYSLIFANLLGVTILTSFCKAICRYFGFLSKKFFVRNLVLTAYFSFTVANNTLYINEYIKKKLVYFPNKIKDRILDKENEKRKVPYDSNMYTYNVDEENKDVFNYI